jgi:hypothetical protein
MAVHTLFTPAGGTLQFRVYADSDDDGVLSAAELAAPVAVSVPAADGAHASDIPAARGQRFWAEVFSVDGNADGVADRNSYTFTFSNLDLVDAGLLAGHPAPNNDSAANAVDLGPDVSWNSSTVTDVLTIHVPTDPDWYRLQAWVPGSLQILVDQEHPELGQVNAQAVDAVTGAPLALIEFQDLGDRLRFRFAPVTKNQVLRVLFSGTANSYVFSMQNHDLMEPNGSMFQTVNFGPIVNVRRLDLSLPGLPDAGTRDEDWFKPTTPATDGRLDVTATPDRSDHGRRRDRSHLERCQRQLASRRGVGRTGGGGYIGRWRAGHRPGAVRCRPDAPRPNLRPEQRAADRSQVRRHSQEHRPVRQGECCWRCEQ